MTIKLDPPAVAAINTPTPTPHVEITITPKSDTSTVTVYRTDAFGVSEVRGGYRHAVAGVAIIEDYEAPFGRPCTYTAQAYDAAGVPAARSASSAPVTLAEVTCPWLHNALIPATALQLTPVDWQARDHTRDESILWPITADAAVVLANTKPRPTSDMTLLTYTDGEASQLQTIFAGMVAILRPPAAWTWPGGPVYIDGITETRIYPKRPSDQRRMWAVTLVPVLAPPAALVEAVNTWAVVTSLYRTWADLIVTKATWLDVIRNPDPGGLSRSLALAGTDADA